MKKCYLRVKEQRNILHEISKWKANWIGHILRRNCLLKQVIEGKIKVGTEVRGRRGRRCRKLLDDLKESRGYSHLKEEALNCTMWRAGFGRGFEAVVRQTTKWMNEWMNEWMNAWHTTSEHPSYSGIYLMLCLLNLLYPNTARTINLNILRMCCYMVR